MSLPPENMSRRRHARTDPPRRPGLRDDLTLTETATEEVDTVVTHDSVRRPRPSKADFAATPHALYIWTNNGVDDEPQSDDDIGLPLI